MNENALKARWAAEDKRKGENAVLALLSSPEGRKYLWWLLEIGGIGRQPFQVNAMQTAFACGELNVGQRILDHIISISPDGYVTMMKEMEDERNSRSAELDLARNPGPGGSGGGDPGTGDY